MAEPVVISKYHFRIRTRQGSIVDKLLIQGRDEADAQRKLRQMYPHCEILECLSRPRAVAHAALRGEPSTPAG